MDEQEFSFIYPTMQIHPERGIIPAVNLPSDYRKRVQAFYQHGRRQRVEEYSRELRAMITNQSLQGFPWEIMLQWDEEEGLTNISIGAAGLDLEMGSFQEHNLGGIKSFAAMAVATKYVSELLKT